MKILLINTYDSGGAAKACNRLHLGLLELGVDSKVLLKHQRHPWPESFKFAPIKPPLSYREKINLKFIRILKELKFISSNPIKKEPKIHFLSNRPKGLEMYSLPYSDFDITESPLYRDADIINLHWVANFLDFKSFFEKNTKPIVWTFHDMNPILGIDHYIENYLGMDEAGTPQIRPISPAEKKINDEIQKFKKECYKSAKHISVVTPSEWLAKIAHNSDLFQGRDIRVIPNAANKEKFRPLDKNTCREILNLPKNKKIILFVADSISNRRKGFEFLEKAFIDFDSDKYVLCSVGKGNLEDLRNIIYLGEIGDERLMSCVYSAADVFIIPSLIDNLPNTVIESLMCGTPVIGFPVGGIPEMITDWKNGLLAEDVSVESLRRAILRFFEHQNEFNSNVIRKMAVRKYNQNRQASLYTKLFQDILDENGG